MTSGELHKFRSEAVPLIYEFLWLGKTPPRSCDKRPWTIGRELSIWNLLVAAKYDPEHINGAISVCRQVRTDWAGERLSMRVYYWRRIENQAEFCATPFLEGSIGFWLKNFDQPKRRERALLPPSVNDTLRRMIS